MTVANMKEYLEKFPDDAEFGFLIINGPARMRYPWELAQCLVGDEVNNPTICLQIKDGIEFDDKLKEIAEREEERARKLQEAQEDFADDTVRTDE